MCRILGSWLLDCPPRREDGPGTIPLGLLDPEDPGAALVPGIGRRQTSLSVQVDQRASRTRTKMATAARRAVPGRSDGSDTASTPGLDVGENSISDIHSPAAEGNARHAAHHTLAAIGEPLNATGSSSGTDAGQDREHSNNIVCTARESRLARSCSTMAPRTLSQR